MDSQHPWRLSCDGPSSRNLSKPPSVTQLGLREIPGLQPRPVERRPAPPSSCHSPLSWTPLQVKPQKGLQKLQPAHRSLQRAGRGAPPLHSGGGGLRPFLFTLPTGSHCQPSLVTREATFLFDLPRDGLGGLGRPHHPSPWRPGTCADAGRTT